MNRFQQSLTKIENKRLRLFLSFLFFFPDKSAVFLESVDQQRIIDRDRPSSNRPSTPFAVYRFSSVNSDHRSSLVVIPLRASRASLLTPINATSWNRDSYWPDRQFTTRGKILSPLPSSTFKLRQVVRIELCPPSKSKSNKIVVNRRSNFTRSVSLSFRGSWFRCSNIERERERERERWRFGDFWPHDETN